MIETAFVFLSKRCKHPSLPTNKIDSCMKNWQYLEKGQWNPKVHRRTNITIQPVNFFSLNLDVQKDKNVLYLENSKTSTSKTNGRSCCIVIGDTGNKMTCRSSRDIKMRFLDFIFSSKAIVYSGNNYQKQNMLRMK